MRYYISILVLSLLLLSGCGSNSTAKQELDYDQTKKMVVDILQTDEGKKALQEIISDDKMKQHLVMDSEVVKAAITEALVSEEGSEMWKKLFQDPEFVKSYVKSTKEGQEKLFKDLMYDAEFQKQLIDLMKDPELANQTVDLLKSQQFREHLEKTIQETLESPLFQSKMKETILKAQEKENKNSKEQSTNGEKSG